MKNDPREALLKNKMKKHYFLFLFITLISFSGIKAQELNKAETLNYISNLYNKGAGSGGWTMDILSENQSLVLVYHSPAGETSSKSFKLRNYTLYQREINGNYWIGIIEETGEERLILFVKSIIDANRMVNAINHLASFVGNEKDPFD